MTRRTDTHIHVHIDFEGLTDMALNLEALTAEVAENNDAVQSAVTLIQALADELRASGGDQAAIDDLANQLDAAGTSLAQAVVDNTDSGTPEEPAPGE